MAGKKERERAFVENGSKLLETMIATCNGKSTPIRNFSFHELKRATNNFDDSLVISSRHWGRWYKGSLEGRTVLIKTAEDSYECVFFINDIAISAMMSAHNNVLRLIGCCLETQVPYIVFEFPANGTLYDRIHHHVSDTTQRQYEPMAWSSRLRIAREIAHAISYLQTAFSRPMIHRYLNMENIFLDQHDVAKLSGFGLSISIPEGETHIVAVDCSVLGSFGYMCPEYITTGRATEKADVYGFGMILFELLTGHKSYDETRGDKDEDYLEKYMRKKRDCINEIVDPTILQGEGGASISMDHQLQAVLDLALTCTEYESAIRPTMVDVTKQLRRIERSIT